MRKINVLLVLTGGIFRDGISLSQLDYMSRIDKNSFNIDIVSSLNDDSNMLREFQQANCSIIYLPKRKNIIKYSISLYKVMKKNKYDIIHVHGSSSMMALELMIAKLNKVHTRIAHSRNTKSNHPFIDKVLRPIFYRSYNLAFACGMEAGNFLFKNRKFELFHNGKDLKKFSFDKTIRNKIRREYHIDDNLAFGNVGNLNYQKNQDFLIKVFYNYHINNPKSLLFIMGEGNKKNELIQLTKDLHIEDSVVFMGNINNINELIQAMDIMLFPSLFEGLPNVVLEWQAAGLPCILSDTITKECKVYDMVYYLPINEGVKEWINCIDIIIKSKINRTELSTLGCNRLIEYGFEINNNTKKLEDF